MSVEGSNCSSPKMDSEESLWETLEDIENIFETELRDLKEISLSGAVRSNSKYNNGNHFGEDEILVWNCGVCGSYYFKDHSHFSSHLLEHHAGDEMEGRNKNVYGCLSCGNGFKNLQVLENHLLCEELCQRDYDKALLALYQSHSVPRFFAPLHTKCLRCQERFDQVYRLLQYFPNCSHLESNLCKRKMSTQREIYRENGVHDEIIDEKTFGKTRYQVKHFSTNSTEVSNTLEDEVAVVPTLTIQEQDVNLHRNGSYPSSTLNDNNSEDEDDLDALISMNSVNSNPLKLKRRKHKFRCINPTDEDVEHVVCYGFNGAKWVHSRSSSRIKSKKKKKAMKKIKFNPSLNVDGTYDDEVIMIDDDESNPSESHAGPSSKETPYSTPCNDCNITNFDSRSSFIFHEIFEHQKAYCSVCDLVFDNACLHQSHREEHHKSFPCDRCTRAFSSRIDILTHMKNFHSVIPCPFCHYAISRDSIELHISKNHRVHDFTLEDISELRIVSEISSSTATCLFCRRKKPLLKMFNHFRNWHYFTTPYLFELLVQSGFSLNNKLTHNAPLLREEVFYSLKFTDKSLESKFPKISYVCPILNCESLENKNQDYGLHLIVDHSLKYCFPCDRFLKNETDSDHNSSYHFNDFKCSSCEECFNNVFSLLYHRMLSHGLITCSFCGDIIFTHKKDFLEHMNSFHAVHASWCSDVSQFFHQLLVSVCTSNSKMRCNLCQSNKEFELGKCGSLRSHLSLHHNLKAFDLLFASYDGQTGFKLSSISEVYPETDDLTEVKFEDDVVCITENDVNVVLESPSVNKEDQASSSMEESFRCDFCPISTSSLLGMKNHLLKVHKSSILVSEEFNFKCSHCDEKFWSLGERRTHINTNHGNESLMDDEDAFTCRICQHSSPNKNALRRHFQRMHPTEPLTSNVSYQCNLCKELFQWKNQLDNHTKEMHKSTVEHECTQCGNTFKSSIGLKNHERTCLNGKTSKKSKNVLKDKKALDDKKTKHPEKNTEDQIMKNNESTAVVENIAEESPRQLADTGDGRASAKSDEGQSSPQKFRKVKCEFCFVVLETPKAREEHYVVAHNGLLPFTCDVCHKGFSTKSSLRNHKNKHGDFKCKFCSKEFIRRDSFNEHLLIHEGPRYTCPHCPKEFVQKSNLQRHIRIHLGIKPYKCCRCPKAFSDSAALKAHESVHQNIKLVCQICSQTFSRKQKLNYHMRIHTGDDLLVCDICSKVFTNSYAMKRHLLTHSNSGRVISCVICSQEFPTRKKLSQHLKLKEKLGTNCTMCGLSYKSETELNTHMLEFHKPNKDNDAKPKGYQCRHCESSFNSLSDIREHLFSKHSITSDLPFHFINGFRNESEKELYPETSKSSSSISKALDDASCSLCGEVSRNFLDLGVHLRSVHQVPCSESGVLCCPICELEIGPLILDFNMHIIGSHKEDAKDTFSEASVNDPEIKKEPEYMLA